MAIQYKQKCQVCKKNYVLTAPKQRNTICFECQEKEMKGEINDPILKEMFDIPPEYYKENGFLRNIKISYLRYGGLSEKQIQAFKNTVDDLNKKHAKE